MTKEEILSLPLYKQRELAVVTDSPKVLDILADPKNFTLKVFVASNVYVSVETLWKLYYEDNVLIGYIIANPNAPEELVLEWNAEKWFIRKPLLPWRSFTVPAMTSLLLLRTLPVRSSQLPRPKG